MRKSNMQPSIKKETTRSRITVAGWLIFFTISSTIASAADDPWIKLSDGQYFSDILNGHLSRTNTFTLTPDGKHVVYIHDPDVDEAYELYSVPTKGGEPVRLSGPLPAGSAVKRGFKVTSDSSMVVFREPSGVEINLYSVPIGGGDLEQLNDRDWSARDVEDDYQIDSSGTYLIVRGNLGFVDGIKRLWKVPLTGALDPSGEELIPAADFHPDGDVMTFAVAGNGTVVYVADQIFDKEYELFAYQPLLFVDGFENGDTTCWSAAIP